ncbi:MAG TPA: Uma2 family endonuclease [Candidatus Baltobacteraceae bacterium]|nr:Uma2 family endonuclease [Candidatus Baltobacteraceae bacterium]
MNMVADLFNERFLKRVTIQNQGMLAELEGKNREPDLVLLRGNSRTYKARSPEPLDVLLVVEVSDSSTRYDRGDKLDLYGRSKIPEYWQVDINEETISVYRRIKGAELKKTITAHPGSAIACMEFPNEWFPVEDFFGLTVTPDGDRMSDVDFEDRRRLITVNEFHRMAALRILRPMEGLELTDGIIVSMSPNSITHHHCVNNLVDLFLDRDQFFGAIDVSIQPRVVLSTHSEPKPDLTLVLFDRSGHERRDQRASDILLAIEVSDSTSNYDRGDKQFLYARSKISEYWQVDLNDGAITIHQDPNGIKYETRRIAKSGDCIALARFPGEFFLVDAILARTRMPDGYLTTEVGVEKRRRPFTVENFHKMTKASILDRNERLELIGGVITTMSHIGKKHRACVNKLEDIFYDRAKLHGKISVLVQQSVKLSDFSYPKPDLTLLLQDGSTYEGHDERGFIVPLVVEVSDSTSKYDRRVKQSLYARSKISEYWQVDLNDRTITVYQDPKGSEYGTKHIASPGKQITCAVFPDEFFSVSDIFSRTHKQDEPRNGPDISRDTRRI